MNVEADLQRALWDSCYTQPFDEQRFGAAREAIDAYAGSNQEAKRRIVNWKNPGAGLATALMTCSQNGLPVIALMLIDDYGADLELRNENGLRALHFASFRGHLEVCQVLLDRGADVHAPDKDGDPPLVAAIARGFTEVCRLLLQHGANVEANCQNAGRPIHLAAGRGNLALCEALLDYGADVHAPDKDGDPALIIAIVNGHTDICRLLLERGTNVETVCQSGGRPLHLAAQSGNVPLCKIILDYGANINAPGNQGGTALHVACQAGYIEMCRLLLERGADVKANSQSNTQPIRMAAQQGHAHICELLLDYGADVEATDMHGGRPLHLASQCGYYDVCQLLLDRGADVNSTGKGGAQALRFACQNGHQHVCQLLLKRGANVNAIAGDGATALHLASQLGYIDMCRLLLSYGADTNIATATGGPPLNVASQNGHREVCQLLLDHGANMELCGPDGRRPLYVASQNGNASVCQLLLDRGASVTAEDEDGWLPLHIACAKGHKDVCEQLLEHGADVNARDPKGTTVLGFALLGGHLDTCGPLLLEHGANEAIPIADGRTILGAALQGEHLSFLRALLLKRQDVLAQQRDVSTLTLAQVRQMLVEADEQREKELEEQSDLVEKMLLDAESQRESELQAKTNEYEEKLFELKTAIKEYEQDPFLVLGKLCRLMSKLQERMDDLRALVQHAYDIEPLIERKRKADEFQACCQELTDKISDLAEDRNVADIDELPSDVRELLARRDRLADELKRMADAPSKSTKLQKAVGPIHLQALNDLVGVESEELRSVQQMINDFLPGIEVLCKECGRKVQSGKASSLPIKQLLTLLQSGPDTTEAVDITINKLQQVTRSSIDRIRLDVHAVMRRLQHYWSQETVKEKLMQYSTATRSLRTETKTLRRKQEDLEDASDEDRQALQQAIAQHQEKVEVKKKELKPCLQQLELAASGYNMELFSVIFDLWVGVPDVPRRSIEDYDRSDSETIIGGRHSLLRCTYEGQPCVLKQFVTDRRGLKEVRRQLKTWTRLKPQLSPYLLPVKAVVFNPQHEHECYIHVPYMENGDLAKYLTLHSDELTAAKRQHILHRILEALQLMHSNKVIHMDIKLENNLIDQDGNPLISDFDISKDLSQRQTTLTTQTSRVGGTLLYMAPELKEGEGSVSTMCDMYSFGVLMANFLGKDYISSQAADLIDKLTKSEPELRLSATQARQHPYFNVRLEDLRPEMVGPIDAPWRYKDRMLQSFEKHPQGYFCRQVDADKGGKLDQISAMISAAAPTQKIPGFVKAVLVHDPHKMMAFYEKMKKLAKRYTSPAFQLDIAAGTLDERILQFVCDNEAKYTMLGSAHLPGPAKLHLRRAYHGVKSMDIAEKILSGDFAALGQTDGGWFGAGIYFTLDLDYALQYAPSDDSVGGHVVLMCDVVFGNPFPMVEEHESRGMEHGSDAHIAVVKLPGAGEGTIDAKPVSAADWDKTPKASEIVLVDTSHILIRAVLVVKSIDCPP